MEMPHIYLIGNKIDLIHIDIMDGKFVPNEAFSSKEINEFECNIPKHVHIMSENPIEYILRCLSMV